MITERCLKPRVGVSVAVIKDGGVLLVRRGKPPYEGLWSLPGGALRFGESPAEGAGRELLEETGLLAERLHLADVVNAITRTDGEIGEHFVIIVYATTNATGTLRAGDDAAGVAWVASNAVDPQTSTPGLATVIVNARRVLEGVSLCDAG